MDNSNIVVYTDGSHTPTRTGIGMVFPDFPELNEGIELPHSTNQVAELTAIQKALTTVVSVFGTETTLTLKTDSTYAIGCLTKWYPNWVQNGWKNSKKEPVANKELIQSCLVLLDQFDTRPTFVWVKGHSSDVYNAEADALAQGKASS